MNELINGLLEAFPELEIRIRKPIQKGYGTYFDFQRGREPPVLIPNMCYFDTTLDCLIHVIKSSLQKCIESDKTCNKALVFIDNNSKNFVDNSYSISIGIVAYKE